MKSYIKIIENLNNGEIINIKRCDVRILVHLRTDLYYEAEVGPRFNDMIPGKDYTLEELGLK